MHISKLASSIWRRFARGGQSAAKAFSCGDCDRRNLCGQPPSDDCVVKLEQIDGARVRRRRWTLYPYGQF